MHRSFTGEYAVPAGETRGPGPARSTALLPENRYPDLASSGGASQVFVRCRPAISALNPVQTGHQQGVNDTRLAAGPKRTSIRRWRCSTGIRMEAETVTGENSITDGCNLTRRCRVGGRLARARCLASMTPPMKRRLFRQSGILSPENKLRCSSPAICGAYRNLAIAEHRFLHKGPVLPKLREPRYARHICKSEFRSVFWSWCSAVATSF